MATCDEWCLKCLVFRNKPDADKKKKEPKRYACVWKFNSGAIEDFCISVISQLGSFRLGEMKLSKTIVSGLVLTLLLTAGLTSASDFEPVKAPETIHIEADGSVNPPTAPIARDGEVYTFADSICGSVVLLKSDIVVDGAGYTLQGNGRGIGVDVSAVSGYLNVTIRNMEIKDFDVGIELASFNEGMLSRNTIANNRDGVRVIGFGQFSSFNNTISGNTITNNENGIVMEGYVVGNLIFENTIANNSKCGIALITWMPLHSSAIENIVSGNTITNNGNGIYLSGSSNNFVYHNNFVENTVQVFTENSVSVWNNGYPSGGNYWSDHICTGNPSDGSQPYVLDGNNTDHYPFQVPNGWAISVAVHVDEIADTNYAATGREALASHLGHLRCNFNTYVNKNSAMNFPDFSLIARNFRMQTLIVQWVCWRQARGCQENTNVFLVKARMHNQFEYCYKDKELWTKLYRRFFYKIFP